MATQIAPIWNTFYTMYSFPGDKIHFHSNSYYGLKWLEILENSFTCGDQNKGEHCSCFPVYFEILKSDNYCHFWLYFANVLLWLNLPNFLYFLVIKLLPFNKVVLHVAFSELSLLLSFQGWQEQVPNSHTSATKDRPNSDYDAGNNLVLLAIRKILLGRLTPEKTLNSKTSLFVLLCRLKRSQMWLTQMWEGAKNRLKSLEKL